MTTNTNLNIFGGKVLEERVEEFGYAASVFDAVQQWKDNFPVVDTAADVVLLIRERVHCFTLVCQTCKITAWISRREGEPVIGAKCRDEVHL